MDCDKEDDEPATAIVVGGRSDGVGAVVLPGGTGFGVTGVVGGGVGDRVGEGVGEGVGSGVGGAVTSMKSSILSMKNALGLPPY